MFKILQYSAVLKDLNWYINVKLQTCCRLEKVWCYRVAYLPVSIFRNPLDLIITARKRSLRRLCFHKCLSVHSGGVCSIACWDTPPGTRGRPFLGRHLPRQTPPPSGRRPPRQTPRGRHYPPHRHPLGQRPPGQTPPSCTVHAGIRSTSGWYASHWNAFLFWVGLTSQYPLWLNYVAKLWLFITWF